MRKLTVMNTKPWIMITELDGKVGVIMGSRARRIAGKIARKLGPRVCASCRQWVRSDEVGIVQIMNNEVTLVLCLECAVSEVSMLASYLKNCA